MVPRLKIRISKYEILNNIKTLMFEIQNKPVPKLWVFGFNHLNLGTRPKGGESARTISDFRVSGKWTGFRALFQNF